LQESAGQHSSNCTWLSRNIQGRRCCPNRGRTDKKGM